MPEVKQPEGSKRRCLILTEPPRTEVADTLNHIIAPYGIVDETEDRWLPKGLSRRNESRLREGDELLSCEHCDGLRDWWLRDPTRGNTPNWDVASTCTMADGKPGLVLVEAKAHLGELSRAGKTLTEKTNQKNHDQIGIAIAKAKRGLNEASSGLVFTVSRDSHYQLSNRFAWAWKIASLGTPVILVYLGFLNAREMAEGKRKYRLITDDDAWSRTLHRYADPVVPAEVWGSGILKMRGVPLYPLIRTLDLNPR